MVTLQHNPPHPSSVQCDPPFQIILEHFGSAAATVMPATPAMPLGQVRKHAHDWLDSRLPDASFFHNAGPYLGSVCMVLMVEDQWHQFIELEMSKSLEVHNIGNSTRMYVVRMTSDADTPPLIQEADHKLLGCLATIDQAVTLLRNDIDEGHCTALTLTELLTAQQKRLRECDWPMARPAGSVQKILHKILKSYADHPDLPLRQTLKQAERDLRDIIVLLCRQYMQDPTNRDDFLNHIEEAYGGDVDKGMRAQVLLAYHKQPKPPECGFPSCNQILDERRGGPRPRRRQ